MKKIQSLLIFGLIITIFSCAESPDQEPQISDLTLSMVAIDDNETEKDVFEEGEKITFGLKILNISKNVIEIDSDWELLYQLVNNEDYLMIYKWETDDRGDKFLSYIGKPYSPPVYFTQVNLPAIKINPGEEIILLRFPWDADIINKSLTEGDYHTSFNHELTIKETTVPLNLELDFSVH